MIDRRYKSCQQKLLGFRQVVQFCLYNVFVSVIDRNVFEMTEKK